MKVWFWFPTTEKKQGGRVLKNPRKTAGGLNKNHGLQKVCDLLAGSYLSAPNFWGETIFHPAIAWDGRNFHPEIYP